MIPGCMCDRCRQGRQVCPCPDACQTADGIDLPLTGGDFGIALTIVTACIAFVGFGPMVLGWLQ